MLLLPSYIAFATSLTSALVGLGLLIIDSSIWVAVITGFPCLYVFLINSFWNIGTSSIGISTPKSPLATIIPSDTSSILSKLSIPSLFSIFEIILICSPPFCFNTSLISITSCGFLTNEAAI